MIWELTEDGILQISGTGVMYDYSVAESNYAPWYETRTSIKQIEIGDEITYIGDNAFYMCNKATKVVLPSMLTSVGEQAFYGCTATTIATADVTVTGLTLPEGVTEVGAGAFKESRLNEVVLPDSLTYIPEDMFSGSMYLRQVDFQDTLMEIGDSAFANCVGLGSIELPEGLLCIGDKAFAGCGAYRMWNSYYTCNRFTSVVLPETLESIGSMAFYNCHVLKSINIPEKVNVIEEMTFMYCYKLKEITFPADIGQIAKDAFMFCEDLETIKFQWNAPSIANSAFHRVEATCYYPGNNSAWTSDMFQNYGNGTLTWVAQEMEVPGAGAGNTGSGGDGEENPDGDGEESGDGSEEGTGGGDSGEGSGNGSGSGSSGTIGSVIINGGGITADAIVTAPTDGWKEGSNTFKISCELPCFVAISNDKGATYVLLEAEKMDGEYQFTVDNMTSETILTVGVIGDVNNDGKVTNADVIKLKAVTLGKTNLETLGVLAADVNQSGTITNADIIKLKAVSLGKTSFSW